MKKQAVIAAGLAVLLLLSACNQPSQSTSEQVTINSTLSSLPDLKLKLPKSLSLESSDTSRTMSRNAGTVTDLTTANVGSVKSESWMSLQQGNGLIPFLNRAFAIIADYAKHTTIVEGQAFTLPVTNAQLASMIGCGENDLGGITVQNKFLVTGQDPRDYCLYALVTIGITQGTSTQQMVVRCKIHLLTPETGSRTIQMLLDCDAGSDMSMRVYADIDATTGACTMVNGSETNGTVDTTSMGVMLSEVGDDGSITDINASTSGGNSYYHVAYGNDAAGGIASVNSWTFRDCDGKDVQSDNYWSEYYDGSGDIIYRSNGSSTLWYAPSTANATNLYADLGSPDAAPEKLFIRYTWSPSSTVEVSTDYDTKQGNATWKTIAPGQDCWGWYCMQGSNWASGDTYYYWQGCEQATDNVIYTLYAGFKVPEAISFDGKSYYMTNEYPLRNLLPITDSYKGSYTLKQKEGETTSGTWNDSDGNTYSWSFTNYDYWLENATPLNEASDIDNCNDSAGDINLNDKLQQYDVYYYSNGTMSKIRSYFFRTTTTLPPYFSNPDPANLAGSVNAKLAAALEKAATIDYSRYAPLIKTSLKNDSTFAGMTP